jgi:hypothetical protein
MSQIENPTNALNPKTLVMFFLPVADVVYVDAKTDTYLDKLKPYKDPES